MISKGRGGGQFSKDNPSPQIGENHSKSKLSNNEVYKIRELLNKGLTQNKVAKILGVNQSIISRILNNKAWKHVK